LHQSMAQVQRIYSHFVLCLLLPPLPLLLLLSQ
jgi:hypothetical protein